MADIPIAVDANGSLLYREDVRNDLSQADVVMPSFDAKRLEESGKIKKGEVRGESLLAYSGGKKRV